MFIVLSNEGYTYIFYDNENDTIETFIYFSVMENKTITDQKIIIISNIKSQIISPKHLLLDIMNTNYTTIPVLTINTIGFLMENIFSRHRKCFQSGGIKIILINHNSIRYIPRIDPLK